MISEQDKSVVYSMCQAGMSVDTLIKSFPKFDADDIRLIYQEYQKNQGNGEIEEINISINCS